VKTKFSKLALLAVEYRLCLYWKIYPYDKWLELRVETGNTETGKLISRHVLSVRGLKQAYEVSQALIKMGGCVFVDAITRWSDSFNPWDFGWEPDLCTLRDATRKMGEETYPVRHPDWDGWHSYNRQIKQAKQQKGDHDGYEFVYSR